ncbi:MAG: S1 RNA-binding domain-containing protein [Eubacteriales bacterium]|jgi:S1 RNA binding domain protein
MPATVGSVLEGIVKGITNFGVFIQLPDGETGLVHISEVARIYVRDINDFLKENDRVAVKVISIDPRGKIGLSIKQVEVIRGENSYQKNRLVASFEEKLNKFLKESDEKQTHLRRSTEAKRGGRGSARREE